MGRPRKYDEEFRARVVALAEANGGRFKAVAAQMGIPESSVRRILHRKGNDQGQAPAPKKALVDAAKKTLGSKFDRVINRYLTKLDDDDTALNVSARDAAVVVGVIFDKKQLLTGGPTGNEHHVVTFRYMEPGSLRKYAEELEVVEGEVVERPALTG